MNIKVFPCNLLRENAWLLWDGTGHGVVVDPGFAGPQETGAFLDYLRAEGIVLDGIWLTHAHPDHILGAAALQRAFDLPVRMDPAERLSLDAAGKMADAVGLEVPDTSFRTEPLTEGETLRCGDAAFQVISTPGHSAGGVCYHDAADGILLTGDTLFAGSIGRTDLPGGDYERLIVSIMDKLMGLPGDTDILPGHGVYSSISRERVANPFLEPWGEAEEDSDAF